jgi:hypothetical protein
VIAAEIQALRKGRGLLASDLRKRLGPFLRELAEGTGRQDGDLRRALAGELARLAGSLPGDLRIAVLASLGLAEQTRKMPLFTERVEWLATQSSYTPRTVQRRIDRAEELLAEEVGRELARRRGRSGAAPGGWYLEEFCGVLRLDTLAPESLERRHLVATRAGLTEVMAWLDVPRPGGQPRPALHAEVIYGGRLARCEEPTSSPSRFEFWIQLPVPLQPGDHHEYGLLLRLPPGEPLRPHYLSTPECHCATLDLRVRFDPAHPPAWIRRVDGETVRTFDDPRPTGEVLSLDAVGEARARFHNPQMYLGYGLQWQP